ncbi:MAG: FAD:protein FMN transferase [Planctomycetota bacterium]|nr:MAG: FAD:protein FMN transferase [Planctomycetota bacterium]
MAQNTPSRRRFLVLLGGAGGHAALGAVPSRGLEKAERTSWALGADVTLTALHENRRTAELALSDAFAELHRIEEAMSLYRPHSQLCRLNREGVLPNPDPYLVDVLRAAADLSARSGGAFDATVQPLWELYAAAGKAGRLPESAAVRDAVRRVDWRKVEVAPDCIRFREVGMAVTLNGIAHGFASDRVEAALKARGVRHALVDTGEFGSLGRKADGTPWTVGIQHPRRPDAYLALAALEDRFLSTSGDYATPFSADFRHHHIFDPRTGLSPTEFSSVTVLARTGMEADALTKVLFVLGLEKGLDQVRRIPGADALCVLKDGRMISTDGFPRIS